MNPPGLVLARLENIPQLLQMIDEYHAFDHLEFDEVLTQKLLHQVISDPKIGRLWLVQKDAEVIGYILVTFGFSLEFKGVNGLVDEFFLLEKWRGLGLGKTVLNLVQAEARALGIQALHLEVTRGNHNAMKLYEKVGFVDNDRFLMTCWLS